MKKFLSLLLALAMIFSLAAGVLAEEVPKKTAPGQPEETATEETAAVRMNNAYGAFYYSTLEQALYTCAYENTGRTTITLLQNMELTNPEPATDTAFMTDSRDMDAPGSLVLDLNGYTLTFFGDVSLFDQLFASNITVKNGTVFFTATGENSVFRQGALRQLMPVEEEETKTETVETVEKAEAEETPEETEAPAEAEEPAEPPKPVVPKVRLTLQNLAVWFLDEDGATAGGSIIRTLSHKGVVTIQNSLIWSAAKKAPAAVVAERPTRQELAADIGETLPYDEEFKPQIVIKNSVVGASFGYALMTESGAATAVVDSVLAGKTKPVADGSFIANTEKGNLAKWAQTLPDGSVVTAEALIYGDAPDASAIPNLTNLPYVPRTPAPGKPVLDKTTLLSLGSSAIVVVLIILAVPKKKEEI